MSKGWKGFVRGKRQGRDAGDGQDFYKFEQLVVWIWRVEVKFLFGVETFRNEVIDSGCNFECVSGSSCCTGRGTERR